MLVVGGGFAGAYVARQLGERGATIVSKENFMLYTPLLPEAASGTLEPRHCVVPLRVMCPHAELVLGAVNAIDLEAQTAAVETDEGMQTVGWSELVLALGAVPRTLPIPGLAEHGLSFKSLADAINLRNRVLHQLEAADAASDEEERSRLLTFVFVGAGYAGVEALAELSDLAEDALRYYPRLRSTPRRWVMVDAAPRSCPTSRSRSATTPRDELGKRGIEMHVDTTLESVSADEVVLGDGTRIATSTLVWTAGVAREPEAARVVAAARREGPRRRRRVPPGERAGARVGARRLRTRPERPQRAARSTDVPARTAPGAAPREEPDRRRPSRTTI